MKITSKAKLARIYATTYNSLFFGQTQATAGLLQAVNEAGTIPATPYQVTTTNSANWVTDLGVFFTATGVQLTRVASSPTTGQYSVAAGVYTFAAADTTLAVQINYTYTAASGAQKITLSTSSWVRADIPDQHRRTYNSKVLNIQLNANVTSKLSFPFKNQDLL